MSRPEQASSFENDFADIQEIGKSALWGAGVFVEQLGINDPVTHLEQYLEHGEAAMSLIDEDLITDCAERLTKPRFINPVRFRHLGDDFLSEAGSFSMRSMTATTEYKFAGNVVDIDQYKRAKIERQNVARLNAWFNAADENDVFIEESLPLGEKERYTLARIYQKISGQELVMHVVTLHNGSIGLFNELHQELGADTASSQGVLELLDNAYAHKPAEAGFEDFLEKYVSAYDVILEKEKPGERFRFGLSHKERGSQNDDMQMVRAQSALRSIYLDSVRTLGASGGYVTPDILNINRRLSLGLSIHEGHIISAELARDMLDRSLQYVMATLNEAPAETLEALAAGSSQAEVYATAGSYGSAAAEAGVRYDGACPSGPGAAAQTEQAVLKHAFRSERDPTKCVKCPECNRIVDLPKDLYKEGIYHCVNCKATYKNGQRLDYKETDSRSKEPDIVDVISAMVKQYEQKIIIDDLAKQKDEAQDEFSKKRLGELLEEQMEVAEQIKLTAGF